MLTSISIRARLAAFVAVLVVAGAGVFGLPGTTGSAVHTRSAVSPADFIWPSAPAASTTTAP